MCCLGVVVCMGELCVSGHVCGWVGGWVLFGCVCGWIVVVLVGVWMCDVWMWVYGEVGDVEVWVDGWRVSVREWFPYVGGCM